MPSDAAADNTRPVALVTSNRLTERGWRDTDTPLVLAALADRGIAAELVAWHDDVDWSTYGLAVLRSPWDMFLGRIDEFLTWLGKVETQTRVLNASSAIHRVLDKHYLRDLAAAGVPVIPTDFVEVGQPPRFPDAEFVVKPVTAGGATDAARYRTTEAQVATRHVAHLHGQGLAAMVQPYVSAIDTEGERAVMFFDGVYSHAIVKQAILKPGEGFEAVKKLHPNPRAYQPTPAERAVARAAFDVMGSQDELLSARIDLVPDAGGNPMVIELELVAPVVFLTHDDGAVDRFVDAVANRLR